MISIKSGIKINMSNILRNHCKAILEAASLVLNLRMGSRFTLICDLNRVYRKRTF